MPWNKDRDNPGLTEVEVKAIIQRAHQVAVDPFRSTQRYEDRWAAYFAVLWYTGRRVSEVLGVLVQDVGPDWVRVVPSKRKDKAPTACWIPDFLGTHLNHIITTGHLRPTSPLFPWTPQGVDKCIKRLAKGAGILRHVHAHMIRHGHARHFARALQERNVNADIVQGAIKQSLGHATWAHTKTYLEPSKDELTELLRKSF